MPRPPRDRTLAAVYRARGNWHQKKSELDLALADYAAAIKFEPKNAENLRLPRRRLSTEGRPRPRFVRL